MPDRSRPRRTGFGFEAIMAMPDHARFRRWHDRTRILPIVPVPTKTSRRTP